MDVSCAKELAEILQTCPHIQEVHLGFNRLSGQVLNELLSPLTGVSLKELDLNANALGDDSAMTIAKFLSSNYVNKLDLTMTQISASGFQAILEVVQARGADCLAEIVVGYSAIGGGKRSWIRLTKQQK
ncbi:MAG: hypothetical protein K0S08_38 [Gammaproteobacteria bacterium]|jgi:Ran GTPase-activating protein (RanGAP) involved in mRNA processing and transport|nr:hypothetical protein [Gammaproteobacteria bacterium]